MGKLVKASRWRVECFEQGSRPSLARISTWIEKGYVPGKIIGGIIYIDADSFMLEQHDVKPDLVTAETLLH